MQLDWGAIETELASMLGDTSELRLDRKRLERNAREIAAGRLGPASASSASRRWRGARSPARF
jgi:hypothetical protein